MTKPRHALAVVLLGLVLVGCAGRKPRPASGPSSGPATATRGTALPAETSRPQSERYHKNQDGGPDGPPVDVSKIPEPVPKSEPRSRYGNRESYSVLGRTYRLMPDSRGYVERGIASWYGNKFHGYMTSSFEPYDMYAFSAAHKTLPLPSFARVTNLENGKSVVVRVNDRGPFHENRLIDLSYAAAVRIGVWPKGTGLVEVRAIDPERPDALPPTQLASAGSARPSAPGGATVGAAPPPAVASAAGAKPRIYLQLGAFGDRANAERTVANAKRAGLDRLDIQSIAVDGRTVHRVRIGPLADVDAADAMTARVEGLGLGAPRVAIER
ncbi:septal ring lytic transglycosylase RlpA family protein [Dokdonella sp.]|uniref:septal ring lytic transglycosylase RlpA family protein n=1 Tax=Dokdonella sp. TaxID=2291710 RepID=UPI00262FBBD1|nr:septal ring lytic transglycosylase RlpA family protein [Dokdonella sp.]